MSNRKSTQRVLGLGVAALATGALLIAINGYAKQGSQGAGRGADVVKLDTVVVTASRSGQTAAALTAAAAVPAPARL